MRDNSEQNEHHYQTIIIGAGPGGLQLGYCLQQRGESYLLLEEGEDAGEFFKIMPRHRRLISINKMYTGFDNTELNMRWDWNSLLSQDDRMLFKRFSRSYFPNADEMVEYLKAFSSFYDLNIRTTSKVRRVRKDKQFHIELEDGRHYTCEVLVMATGRSKPYVPDIPGIEHAELYSYVSIDPDDFIDQRVFIVGKGNSAFETADNLIGTASVLHLASPNSIKMAWKSHYVGHLRAVNNNILDTYQLKSQNTIIDGEIESIRSENERYVVQVRYSHAGGQRIDVPVDRIILAAGFVFDDGIFEESARPELTDDGKFPKMSSEWESVNVNGMYFSGALMHSRDYKKTFSGFIHGFRYNVEVLARLLDYKYHGIEFPAEPVVGRAGRFLEAIYRRIHTNSSLFQQPGFLCDLLVLPDQADSVSCDYYEDLPVDYVHESRFSSRRRYLMMTMEYGKMDHADPFNIVRVPEAGDESVFIHPVLRYYEEGAEKMVYHIPEDLENNWYQAMYISPFYQFLCELFGPDEPPYDLSKIELPFESLNETTYCR